ncbi:MAG: hypothetical protein ABSF81_12445 [Bacteroidales bacterium]
MSDVSVDCFKDWFDDSEVFLDPELQEIKLKKNIENKDITFIFFRVCQSL